MSAQANPRSASGNRLARARPGFTLVELLVVVAILLVLAGILIPVINTVRIKAQQVNCASRLRQTALAFTAYRSDYAIFPKVEGGLALLYPHVAAATSLPAIPDLLKDYADGNPTIFYCPANKQARTPATHWPNAALSQYSMSYQFMPWANPANFLVAIPNYKQPAAGTLLLSDFYATTDIARVTGAVWNHDNGAGVSGMNACYGDGHVAWIPAAGGTWTNWYRDSANRFYWWALGW